MAARLTLFVPRFIALTVIVLLATATLTFAADNGTVVAPAPQAAAVAAKPAVLVVPDVRNEVYVFAKSTLEEAGFAWKVTGGVPGYPANRVAAQSPAPGTRVIDTGAPTISVSLNRNSAYEQKGEPENASRFSGTALVLADAAGNPIAVPKARHHKPKKKAAPKRTHAPKKRHAPKKKHAPKQKARLKPKAKPKRVKPKAKRTKRPPAFTVPGGRSEPPNEIPLSDRARLLGVWLSSHPEPTDPNVRHWLYQHAWVVEGARLGWWHGDRALETLIRVDRRVQSLWGVGAKSEAAARAALVEVRAKSR